MVLDQSGTVDRDKFLRHVKGLSIEEMESMDQHFSASNRPFCLPHYENDRLKSVYYIVKDYRYSSSLLCFVTIPIETLTGSARPGQVSFCFTVTTGCWRSAIGKPIWMSFFQI